MTRPRSSVVRPVAAVYRAIDVPGAPVWRAELDCGHVETRSARSQPRRPAKLRCWTCTRAAVGVLT